MVLEGQVVADADGRVPAARLQDIGVQANRR
jgi:hypothetical protein